MPQALLPSPTCARLEPETLDRSQICCMLYVAMIEHLAISWLFSILNSREWAKKTSCQRGWWSVDHESQPLVQSLQHSTLCSIRIKCPAHTVQAAASCAHTKTSHMPFISLKSIMLNRLTWQLVQMSLAESAGLLMLSCRKLWQHWCMRLAVRARILVLSCRVMFGL